METNRTDALAFAFLYPPRDWISCTRVLRVAKLVRGWRIYCKVLHKLNPKMMSSEKGLLARKLKTLQIYMRAKKCKVMKA